MSSGVSLMSSFDVSGGSLISFFDVPGVDPDPAVMELSCHCGRRGLVEGTDGNCLLKHRERK